MFYYFFLFFFFFLFLVLFFLAPGKTEHNEFVRCNWALLGYVSGSVLDSVLVSEFYIFRFSAMFAIPCSKRADQQKHTVYAHQIYAQLCQY